MLAGLWACGGVANGAPADEVAPKPALRLTDVNTALETLARRVSPAVVRIVASGYAPISPARASSTNLVTERRATGSGVIVSADGDVIIGREQNIHTLVGQVGPMCDFRCCSMLLCHTSVWGAVDNLGDEFGRAARLRRIYKAPLVVGVSDLTWNSDVV